jgi:hypothetical protein
LALKQCATWREHFLKKKYRVGFEAEKKKYRVGFESVLPGENMFFKVVCTRREHVFGGSCEVVWSLKRAYFFLKLLRFVPGKWGLL